MRSVCALGIHFVSMNVSSSKQPKSWASCGGTKKNTKTRYWELSFYTLFTSHNALPALYSFCTVVLMTSVMCLETLLFSSCLNPVIRQMTQIPSTYLKVPIYLQPKIRLLMQLTRLKEEMTLIEEKDELFYIVSDPNKMVGYPKLEFRHRVGDRGCKTWYMKAQDMRKFFSTLHHAHRVHFMIWAV